VQKLIEKPFEAKTRAGLTHHVLAGSAHWRHLANKIE